MSELRWNPITREWIIMATGRQERPVFPEDYCPFCPSISREVTEGYDHTVLPNRYPSLTKDAPEVADSSPLFRRAPARGACEVVLYSPDHGTVLEDQPVGHIKGVVDLWQERYRALGEDPEVKYVFIFENRGKEIGVTLEHPHGQIYAYPLIPAFIQRRLDGSEAYAEETGGCIYCDIIAQEEAATPSRVVAEEGGFIAVVPFWAKWSYEVNIYPRRHVTGLDELTEEEKRGLAGIMKRVMLGYDGLFGFRLPFIMAVHQRPTDGETYDHCHLCVEFYPPHRGRDSLKYLGGSETGAGAHINVTSPEEAAEELRRVEVDDNR